VGHGLGEEKTRANLFCSNLQDNASSFQKPTRHKTCYKYQSNRTLSLLPFSRCSNTRQGSDIYLQETIPFKPLSILNASPHRDWPSPSCFFFKFYNSRTRECYIFMFVCRFVFAFNEIIYLSPRKTQNTSVPNSSKLSRTIVFFRLKSRFWLKRDLGCH